MATRNCGKGKFYRKSYTRRGTRVAGRCIRSQTRYASPLKISHIGMRGVRMTKRALRNCPTGFIKRASFTRRTRSGRKSVVPEQCIRNIGAPGKGLAGGPGIGPLRKGELAKYGYSNVIHLSESARHAALARAVKAFGSLGVWRKLNAVHVYTRRLSPASSKVFKADMDWIRSKYGIKAF
jgi:hypothetical protein